MAKGPEKSTEDRMVDLFLMVARAWIFIYMVLSAAVVFMLLLRAFTEGPIPNMDLIKDSLLVLGGTAGMFVGVLVTVTSRATTPRKDNGREEESSSEPSP